MKIGVISRIIGVPPTGPKPILTYADSVPDEYDSLYMQDVDNPTPVMYSGSVKLGEAHYIYLKFNSDSAGTLYVTGHNDWDLVDPTTYEILLDQSVVDSGTAVNCIRFNGLTSGTWDSITIQVKALQGWYYTMSDALAVPEFTVVGYLLTTFPAAVGYSLSRIEENATKAVRVQRSGDGAQTDVGDAFLSGTSDLGWVDDVIDMDALLSWTQAGGSAPGAENCYVVIVYNQQADGASNNILPAALHTFTSPDVTKCPRLIANGTKCQTTIFGKTRPVLNTRKAVTVVTSGVSTVDGTNTSIDDGRQMFVDTPTAITAGSDYIGVYTLGYCPTIARSTLGAGPMSGYSRLWSIQNTVTEILTHYTNSNAGSAAFYDDSFQVAKTPNGALSTSVHLPNDSISRFDYMIPNCEILSSSCIDGDTGEFTVYHEHVDKAGSGTNSKLEVNTVLSAAAPFSYAENTNHIYIPGGWGNKLNTEDNRYTFPYCWHTFVVYADNGYAAYADTIRSIIKS